MSKTKITILDESLELSKRFNQDLLDSGYEVSTAHNLHEIFHLAKINTPDVILVGDTFHKQTYYEICNKLRSEIDTCYAIIVCLVTAMDANTQRCSSEIGINEIVEKQIDSKTLIDKIEGLLTKR